MLSIRFHLLSLLCNKQSAKLFQSRRKVSVRRPSAVLLADVYRSVFVKCFFLSLAFRLLSYNKSLFIVCDRSFMSLPLLCLVTIVVQKLDRYNFKFNFVPECIIDKQIWVRAYTHVLINMISVLLILALFIIELTVIWYAAITQTPEREGFNRTGPLF